MYICLDSAQQNSGMKEYYAMYLEALNLGELRKKLALKCNLSVEQLVAIYRYASIVESYQAKMLSWIVVRCSE